MKLIVTFKMPFDTPVGDVQNLNVVIDNVSSMVYNESTGILTVTYGSNNTTVNYIYNKYLFMLVD